MDTERDPRIGQVPLPGFADSSPPADWVRLAGPGETTLGSEQARSDGVRRVRRISNWTAAALIVGTGATTLALAHQAIPVSIPAIGVGGPSAAGGVSGTAVTNGTGGPQVSHSVATTSASGVVTTTTTTPSGRVVVTHNRASGATYQDD